MRLKISLLTLMLAAATSLSAQQYAEDYVIKKNTVQDGQAAEMIYGVMGGVLIPVMSDKAGSIDISNTAGYEVGMMWGIDLGGLEIVPEIWYQHTNSDFCYADNSSSKGKIKSHSIEMPIIFGIEMGPVRFNFGPSLALMSSGKIDLDGASSEADLGRTKSTAGYLLGLSSTLFDHLILDLRYTGRFATADSGWDDGYGVDESVSYRYYSFGVNVGYKF